MLAIVLPRLLKEDDTRCFLLCFTDLLCNSFATQLCYATELLRLAMKREDSELSKVRRPPISVYVLKSQAVWRVPEMMRHVLLVVAKHTFCTLPSQVAVSTLQIPRYVRNTTS